MGARGKREGREGGARRAVIFCKVSFPARLNFAKGSAKRFGSDDAF